MLLRSLVLALTLASAFAQTVSVRPNLHAGESFTLEIRHTRTDARSQNSGGTTARIAVKVLEAGPGGYLLDWLESDVRYDNPQQGENPIVAAAAKVLAEMHLLVKLSPQGGFAGLQNQAAVTEQLQRGMEVVLKGVLEQVPEAQRAAVQAGVTQIMQPAVVLNSATRDIQLYFNLHGAELALGQPVEVDVQPPNPLNGEPMPAKVRVAFDKSTEDAAELSVRTDYDEDLLEKVLLQMLNQAAGRPVSASELPELDLHDGGTYVLDRASGLMRSVDYTRRIEAGAGQGRTDQWRIALVAPPKR